MPLILSGSAGLSGNVGNVTKDMLPAGSVLQVVQASSNTKTATTSSTSLMSASITPTSATNKILILISMALGNSNLNGGLQVRRNGTLVGTQAATTFFAGATGFNTTDDGPSVGNNYQIQNFCYNTTDSPASTSSLTYDLYYQNVSGGTVYFNQQLTDNGGSSVSTITLMEIKA